MSEAQAVARRTDTPGLVSSQPDPPADAEEPLLLDPGGSALSPGDDGDPACESMPELMFGRYQLQELIGRGGMGEIYRAYDTIRGRVVALKRLPAGLAVDPVFQARFRSEAELAARLHEPHVIPIHDFGEIDGQLYIDMRLVEGPDLATVLTSGPLPARRAVDIITQIASALDAAHTAGLVHRDIKPANILLTGPDTGTSAGDFVYVADFGIARAVDGSTSGALTSTGTMVGSLDYIAPERFDRDPGDRRVDIYALGCLLFQALTGQRPFPVEGLPAIINAHLNTPPPAVSALRPSLPAGLDAVVACAMAKHPDDRYPTAAALAADARRALDSATDIAIPTSEPVRDAVTVITHRRTGTGDAATTRPAEQHPDERDAIHNPVLDPDAVTVRQIPAQPAGDSGHRAQPSTSAGPPEPAVLPAHALIPARRSTGLRRALLAVIVLIMLAASVFIAWPHNTSAYLPQPAAEARPATSGDAGTATSSSLTPTATTAAPGPAINAQQPRPRPNESATDPGPPPATLGITTRSLPKITVAVAYSATLKATGGSPPYRWTLTNGSPPPGITLDPSGVLSGTATQPGPAEFTVNVTDAEKAIATKHLTSTVVAPLVPIPDVLGKSSSQARNSLAQAGFSSISVQTVDVGGNAEFAGRVVDQNPAPGNPADPNTAITLFVAKPPTTTPTNGLGLFGDN